MRKDRFPYVLPKEPKGVDDYLKTRAENNYLIYNNKTKLMGCSYCGKIMKIPDKMIGCICEWKDGYYNPSWEEFTGKLVHNRLYRCPNCNVEVRAKSEGRSRKNIADHMRLFCLTRKGNTVYGFHYLVDLEFKEMGFPEVKKRISDVYKFNSKEQARYSLELNYYTGKEEWNYIKTMNIPAVPSSYSYYGGYGNYNYIETYEKNLETVFTKSDLKYLWNEEKHETILGRNIIYDVGGFLRFINDGIKYQSIELLIKAGFTNVVKNRIIHRNCKHLYWPGKTLQKILRLPPRHIKRLQKENPGADTIGVFQTLSEKEKRELSFETIWAMDHDWSNNFRKDIEKYTSLLKWDEYAKAQFDIRYYSEESERSCDHSELKSDWCDYMEACEKLGMDIRKKSIIFPEDLTKAHDDVMEELTIKENEELDKAIKAKMRVSDFESDGLKIIPAQSQLDLNKESAGLGHCVKTYGDRIAKNKCWIFFVRKIDKLNKPFYTLETTVDGEIVQCRGKNNCNMTEEVENFINLFSKNLIKEIKKERKTKCQKKTA